MQELLNSCTMNGMMILGQGRVHASRAVEGDDWSSVIDGQTAETLADGGNPAAEEAGQYPIATPFARASVHRSIGELKVTRATSKPCTCLLQRLHRHTQTPY